MRFNVMENIIIEKRVLRYIKKKVKNEINFENVLKKYGNIASANSIVIVFTKCSLVFQNPNLLNANGLIKNVILVSPEWAYQLVTNNTLETETAFLTTIGHELTHQDQELFSLRFLRYGVRAIEFLAKVNEVRCDFGGGQKMLDANREKLLQTIMFKKNLTKKDKGNFFHPTWSRRFEYVKDYNFNEVLIRRIAKDMNYNNEKIIKKVCDYYKDITLS